MGLGHGVNTFDAIGVGFNDVRKVGESVSASRCDGWVGTAHRGGGRDERPAFDCVWVGHAERIEHDLFDVEARQRFVLGVGEYQGSSARFRGLARCWTDVVALLSDLGHGVLTRCRGARRHVDQIREHCDTVVIGDRINRSGRARRGAGQGEDPVPEQSVAVSPAFEQVAGRWVSRRVHVLMHDDRRLRRNRIGGVHHGQDCPVCFLARCRHVAGHRVAGDCNLIDVIDAGLPVCVDIDQVRERRVTVAVGDSGGRSGATFLGGGHHEGPSCALGGCWLVASIGD